MYIEELDNKYDEITVYEKSYWDTWPNDPWEQHPQAIHHNTDVKIKEYIEINPR